ncbi:MAG: protein-(glutamine-N5) methyltransferase, release factor-specific [Bdellovibrionaceae bacterium]|nr:protein-(glutamine-N5) methyltransferase, release factor-specific [Pseudobdellovibrionaceae bacterium]|tara:strand:+ start:1080 stop:1916 length:837 start_codon:yes stop_codon:yes gene_type:complete
MRTSLFQEELIEYFKSIEVENPQLEVRWILESIGLELWTEEISEDKKEYCWKSAKRRSNGEPLAYILGLKGFYKDEFAVQPGVLIPRPETELLVTQSLEWLKSKELYDPLIYDFGCGSGCVGLSILRDCVGARLVGFDIEDIPIRTSNWNSEKLRFSDRSEFKKIPVEDINDLEIFPPDLIVANPPYIAPDDKDICPHVKSFEPQFALFAEDNGLGKIKSWAKKSNQLLKPGGFLTFEFGRGQEDAVFEIFKSLNFQEITFHKDLAGITRTVSAIKES